MIISCEDVTRGKPFILHGDTIFHFSLQWIFFNCSIHFVEIDYCYDSPCVNNGTCYNDLDNYTCVCPMGFTGQNCEGESSNSTSLYAKNVVFGERNSLIITLSPLSSFYGTFE